MYSDSGSSWLYLVAPFGLIVYVAFLLGFLWVAARVVRHAWYWQSASQKARHEVPATTEPEA